MTAKKSQVAFTAQNNILDMRRFLCKTDRDLMENPRQKRPHPFEWWLFIYSGTQLTIGKHYGGSSILHNNTNDLNANLSTKVQTKC